MRRALRTVLVTLLAGITLLSELGETAIVQRSLEELNQEADTIVIGTVTTQLILGTISIPRLAPM